MSARLRSHVGRPGEVVCHFAVEEKAAFIVIGARGVSALKRAVLGSVSDYILRHAQCPVVVCRDPLEIERQRRRHASADSSQLLSRSGVQRQDPGEDLQKVQSYFVDIYVEVTTNGACSSPFCLSFING